MDSVASVTEELVSNIAGDVKDCSAPSSKYRPLETTVDTPPSSPVAEANYSRTAAAPKTTEKMTDVKAPKLLEPSTPVNESDDGLEGGEGVENSQSMTPGAGRDTTHDRLAATASDIEIEGEAKQAEPLSNKTSAQQQVISSEDADLPETIESCSDSEVDPLMRTAHDDNLETAVTKKIPEPYGEERVLLEKPSVFFEAENSKQNAQHEDTDKRQMPGVAEKEETGDDSEGEAFGDAEDTAVEMQREENTPSALLRSVPPHMRPTFKTPNVQHPGPHAGRREWPAPTPRIPRVYYPPVAYQPSRATVDHDELQRTKAQLMKARNDLEIERKIRAEMRRTVEAEKQASFGAAMSDMLIDLLQKQADALTAKAKTQEKERDLQYREQKIAQLESYLSDGQKQLKLQLEQQGIRSMSAVDETNLRHEVELKMRHQFADIQGKIAIQVERLHHQEAAQKAREQQYKALIHDALKDEVREQCARDLQTKATDTKVQEAAYKRGLAEGKGVGSAGASEAALKQGFLKGYAVCYRSQVALHNMRNGNLVADSPELCFLYDPTHAENPHNIGLSIGRMELAVEEGEESTVGVVISRKSMEEGTARAAAIAGEPKLVLNAVTHRGRGQAQFNNPVASSSDQALPSQQAHPAQTQQVQTIQQEEPARSSIPRRPTFAGELRGFSASATPNGIFTSRLNPQPTPNPSRSIASSTANGVPRASMADRVGEGVYAGRRTIRYEDSDVEPASPNLIDLY